MENKNKTTILFDERPIVIPPSLAWAFGHEKAAILQQIHYWTQRSSHWHHNRVWTYKTYKQMSEETAIPERSVRRHINALKGQEVLLIDRFNKTKMDKTNWYAIDYAKLQELVEKDQATRSDEKGQSMWPDWPDGCVQSGQLDVARLATPIPENTHRLHKNIKKDAYEEQVIDVVSHLNKTAKKSFSPDTPKTKELIVYWLKQGRTVSDLKAVIDWKCQQWLNNSEMERYLRPMTLFRKVNFENYLNEIPKPRMETSHSQAMSYEDQMAQIYGENWRAIEDEQG